MDILYFHSSVEPFLQEIRNFDSPDPEVLPQRSNFDYIDDTSQNRNTNRIIYAQCKDEYVEKYLGLSSHSEYSGLYFFFDKSNKNNPFFYIGKADNLYKRLTKHLLTFDYFFYASAFPKNFDQYYLDCLRFYAEGIYQKNKILYKRQFELFKVAPFKEIGWISLKAFSDVKLLKMVEDNSIYFFKPKANGTNGNMRANELSKNIFEEIEIIVNNKFL